MSETEFQLRRDGDLAIVTIDNGEDWTKPCTFGRHALESLGRTLDEIESQEWAGLVLTGKPQGFAVGADIDQFPNVTPELAREGSRAGHELFLRLRNLPFPTLAAINGAALGGGLEIALHCDHRTIARSVRHVGTPEVFLGLFPAWGGTQLLPRLVGPAAAVKVVVTNPLRQNRMLDARAGARARARGRDPRRRRVPRRVDRLPAERTDDARGGRPFEHGRGDPARTRRAARPCARASGRTRPDRGRGEVVARGGLPRRGGRDRRPAARAAGAELDLRLQPRRAASEARCRRAEGEAAPCREGRHRRRRLDGAAARDAVREAARGPARAPRPHGRARRRRARGRPSRGRRERATLVSGTTGWDGLRGLRPRARGGRRAAPGQAGGLRDSARARAERDPRLEHVVAVARARWAPTSGCTSSTRWPCCRSSRSSGTTTRRTRRSRRRGTCAGSCASAVS